MGFLSKAKSKVKSVAKPSTLAKVALAATGVGAITMGASALAAKKAEKAEYKISSWGPLESDPTKVSIKYSPVLSIAKSDKITVSGTPFDGEYTNTEYRTRNEVYIKPATPVTTSGTGGTFKLKTSMAARAKGAASATKAEVRTAAKKTGDVVKKGAQKVGKAVGGVAGALWNRIKMYVYIAIAIAVLGGGAYLYMQYKARQALMGAVV